MLITTLVVSFLVCCMLVVRCGRAGVVSELQAKVTLVDEATRQRPGRPKNKIQQPAGVENVIIIIIDMMNEPKLSIRNWQKQPN